MAPQARRGYPRISRWLLWTPGIQTGMGTPSHRPVRIGRRAQEAAAPYPAALCILMLNCIPTHNLRKVKKTVNLFERG